MQQKHGVQGDKDGPGGYMVGRKGYDRGDGRFYAQVTTGAHKPKTLFAHMEFNREIEDLARFEKAYVGVVENPSMTYNI